MMTSRERVLAANSRKETDRLPVGFECHPGLMQKIMDYYGVTDRLSLFAKMGIDGFSVFFESFVGPKYIGPEQKKLDDGTVCDFWGIDFHQRSLPLGDFETIADLDKYNWPSADWFDYSDIYEKCLKVKESGLPVVGGEGGCGVQFAINMRGYENALVDPMMEPDFAHAYMQRAGDFFVEWNERWLSAAKGEFDIFRCGDEIGANDRMHCSPEIWREFYKPQLKRIFAVAKSHGLKIWFHCCGMCRPVIDDLIEIGVDLWDPVPGYVNGNNHSELKKSYGDRLAFIGGVDTVTLLRYGTVEQVRAAVKQCIDTLGAGGGYILGGSQCLTDDIPLENAIAMFDIYSRNVE